MAPAFSRNNALALAVLTVLWNEPMHPYRMMQVLEQQRKDDDVHLTVGALYSLVEALMRHGLIEAVGSEQNGHRPPRTVYAVTDEGIEEASRWIQDLLSHPSKEYPKFTAALTSLAFLPPQQVAELLRIRVQHLEESADELENIVRHSGLPEILLVEKEYAATLTRAELTFTRSLIDRIESGALSGVAACQSLHNRLAARGTKRPSADEIHALTIELGLSS
ncbi:PadR family transcriptional regulator [Nocardia sp. NPDC051030]|uniref:PadR family transcriptional regulator n=1 Tax=Nocardia sp. NPDC051030 TaxID=3155162 RepID=UPI00342E492E